MNSTVKPIRLGGIFDKDGKVHQAGSIWDKDYIAPTLDTMQGGYRQPLIIEGVNMDKYYLSERMKTYINDCSNNKYKVNKNLLNINRNIACTKTTREGYTRTDCNDYICHDLPFKKGDGINVSDMDLIPYKIRKLTPTECYKLQGFTAEDCKKASDAGVSNSQLYKQAGNSICVAVLEAIYKSLSEKYDEFKPLD